MPEGGKKTVLIWVVNTNVHCTCLNSMYEYLYIQHGCVKLPKKTKVNMIELSVETHGFFGGRPA